MSSFNEKQSSSIRTKRIKLRHQNIRLYITYRKRQYSPADYLSRYAMSWNLWNKFENKESHGLTYLSYTLHVSPAIYAIGIKKIA